MSIISSDIKGLNPEFETKSVEFFVQASLFSESLVLRACYSLGAGFHKLNHDDEFWKIKVVVPLSYDDKDISKLEADINQELVDFKLREKIFAETEVTRNLILANAFANTSISK